MECKFPEPFLPRSPHLPSGIFRILISGALIFFLAEKAAYAWGGPEHTAITTAALGTLPRFLLSWLGAEFYKWTGIYCNYPDFNWARYGEVFGDKDEKFERFPDTRRDWDASFYCGFNEATGQGNYYHHGPQSVAALLPEQPDERSRRSLELGLCSEAAVVSLFEKSLADLRQGLFRDGIRFAGALSHYLEDSTPPPHVLIPAPEISLHHPMEKIRDLPAVSLDGYRPEKICGRETDVKPALLGVMEKLVEFSRGRAPEIQALVKAGKLAEAQVLTVECALAAGRSAADVALTLFSFLDKYPETPEVPVGVNLLKNPSADEDVFCQNHPDSWVREWMDLGTFHLTHIWDRCTPRNGKACLKLFETPEGGVGWRLPWALSIPVKAGQVYEFSGYGRPECATGENFLYLRFFDERLNPIKEIRSESITGTSTWRPMKVAAAVPEGAIDLLAGCFSRNNRVAVLFDDFVLVRKQ